MNELFSLQGFNNVIVCFLPRALESSHWWYSSGRRNVADAGIKRNQPQDTFGIEMILFGLWKCAMEKLFNSNRIQTTAEEDHGVLLVAGWCNGLIEGVWYFHFIFFLAYYSAREFYYYYWWALTIIRTEEMLQSPTMSSNPFVCQQRKSSSRSAI